MMHDYQDDEDRDVLRALKQLIKQHTNNIDVRFTLIELQAHLKKVVGYVPKEFK